MGRFEPNRLRARDADVPGEMLTKLRTAATHDPSVLEIPAELLKRGRGFEETRSDDSRPRRASGEDPSFRSPPLARRPGELDASAER